MNDKGLFYIVPHFLVENLRKEITLEESKRSWDMIKLTYTKFD